MSAEENLNPQQFKPGDTAQYRKVGKVQVAAHTCPAGRDCANSDTHEYEVNFVTGPKKYRERPAHVWLTK